MTNLGCQATLSFLLFLLGKVLLVVIVVVKLSHSPIWTTVIVFFLLFLYNCTLFLGLLVDFIWIAIFGRWCHTCSECICLRLDNLLSFSCLLFLQFLILICIYSLRTHLFTCSTCHLLSHHLLKCTIFTTTLSEFEKFFRLLIFLFLIFFFFFSKLTNIGF